MELTKRQAIFLITISLIVNKVQRLPSIVSPVLGRHSWLFFIIMGAIDILFTLIVLWFNKLAHSNTTYELIQKTGGTWLAKLVYILFALYFFSNILLPYEAIHDLFANILFDQLSWEVYGIILMLTVLYIATRGLKNIGRMSEVFFGLIVVSFIVLLFLGAGTTSFSKILPIADINYSDLFKTCFNFNLWFGDFLIIFMFVGRIKQDDGKLGWSLVVTMVIGVLLISFAYMIFYGLFENLTLEQSSLIGFISQFSLLGLDIGRVDWFLVLFFQIGAVISSSLYLYLTAYSIKKVFETKKMLNKDKLMPTNKTYESKPFMVITLVGLSVVLFVLDIAVLKSVKEAALLVANLTKYFSLFITLVLPLMLLLIALVYNSKLRKDKKKISKENNKFLKLTKAKEKTHG